MKLERYKSNWKIGNYTQEKNLRLNKRDKLYKNVIYLLIIKPCGRF